MSLDEQGGKAALYGSVVLVLQTHNKGCQTVHYVHMYSPLFDCDGLTSRFLPTFLKYSMPR